MKKPIPTPFVVVAIILVVGGLVFAMMRMGSTNEFAGPKNVPNTIPKYVYDSMSPDMKAQMKAKGYTVVDGAPMGQPSQPPGVARQ